MHNQTILFALTLSSTLLAVAAFADESSHWLLNPTPKESMRPMHTDTPQTTRTPYTVDAGHFQLEMNLVDYSHDERSFPHGYGLRSELLSVAPMKLKAGICDRADFELRLEPYLRLSNRMTSPWHSSTSFLDEGFGRLETAMKINVWGNDTGATALAVVPYVRFPTIQFVPDQYSGGLLLPFSAQLPAGLSLGIMSGADIYDRSTQFVNSASLTRKIAGGFSGYAEFFSWAGLSGGWSGSAGVGLFLEVSEGFRLHLGSNFGVTENAPDYNPFVGLSWRY